MISIPTKITPPLSRQTLAQLNAKVTQPLCRENINDLNKTKEQAAANTALKPENQINNLAENFAQRAEQADGGQASAAFAQNFAACQNNACNDMVIPPLHKPLQKGQKVHLDPQNNGLRQLKIGFGWNLKDERCDIDAEAFLLAANGKVPGDDWFVFYGQDTSPDGSVVFNADGGQDREYISVDLAKINPSIQKIVFVLTINEALANKLNFSMVKDAYVRILDEKSEEILSFKLDQYYENVISMTIGELYLHNGKWKFNPVGNGVWQDLAGQCAIYGVEVG